MSFGPKPNMWFWAILGILFFFNLISWVVARDLNKTQGLEINFFDVGQGDAIFIVSPKRQQILIDGGPDSTILEKLAIEMPFWDNTLDLIILSHPEADHLVGLIEVLKRYKVENIFWTGIIRDTSEYKEWTEAIEKEKAQIKIVKVGQKIKLSSNPNNLIYFDILYPFEELAGQEFKNSNDTSITTKLVFNGITFLFTGDISDKVEKELVLANLPLESDILKVGHHGSKYSSSDYFLENVLPEIAIIQAGKNNPYSHPTKEVLDRLEKFGIKVLRTDLDGDIKIISDGKNYEISSF